MNHRQEYKVNPTPVLRSPAHPWSLQSRPSVALGLLVAALLAFVRQAAGQEFSPFTPTNRHAAAAAAVDPALVGEGPDLLKKQKRVVVDTNSPVTTTATNLAAPKEKSFEWYAAWKGWEGLHLGLTRKTWIDQLIPGVPNAGYGLIDLGTNSPIIHLEEARMAAKIGAKVAFDAAAFESKNFDFDDGFELRRARIYAKGDCLILLPVSYQFELGYVPHEFYIEESYLTFKDIPYLGELKLGQYQAPMGLDVITSSRDIALMEPAAPLQALAPGVNAGLQLGQPVFQRRATWGLGLFTDSVGSDFGDASQNFARAIGRITALPYLDETPGEPNSTRLLHLGLSGNFLHSANSTVRYQARPESHLASYVLDTGDVYSDRAAVIGAEVAWVNGPFSVQAEYLHSVVDLLITTNASTAGFDGFYVSTSWFLTGETRPYSRAEGCFGRVIPNRNFSFDGGGSGAWEVVARMSYTDLNSGDIQGGRLTMFMGGLNWYLHSHFKFRFDYGFGNVSGRSPEGSLSVFQTRMEVDF